MAEQDRPNQSANKSKAEGDRVMEQERGGTRGADRDSHPERLYEGGDSDDAGGITNRPLSDEVENQESLPDRGTSKDHTGNPDARRKEGDYQEDER